MGGRPLRYAIALTLAVGLLARPAAAAPAGEIWLWLGRPVAQAGPRALRLPVVPALSAGSAVVPVRPVAAVLGARVRWDPATRTVDVWGDRHLRLRVGSRTAWVDGVPRRLPVPVGARAGHVVAPLRALAEVRGLWVQFRRSDGWLRVRPLRPPVARFSVSRTVVAQGERVTYLDESVDPDGDPIVRRQWEGRRDAWFAPGTYPVTLRVQDATGQWSDPYTVYVTVTEERVLDPFSYFLRYGEPGESFDTGRNLRELPEAPVEWATGGPALIFSNSPERVPGPGVLYRDTLAGPVRVFFWHRNASRRTLQILLVAENPTSRPVAVRVLRASDAQPGRSPLQVGRAAMVTYLGDAEDAGRQRVLAPGAVAVLGGSAAVQPDEVAEGLLDLDVDGGLTLSVIAVEPGTDLAAAHGELPPLAGDGQDGRGTFPEGDRELVVRLPAGQPARVVLVGDREPPLEGMDAMTGRAVRHRGKYGVVYTLRVLAEEERAVLLNPRGGAFAGAAAVDGRVVPAPASGFVARQSEVVHLGWLPAGREVRLRFSPPGGSYLPVALIFWPLP